MKKIDTRCLSCDCEFHEGELKLYNNDLGHSGWGCPSCYSHSVEEILVPVHVDEPIKFKKKLPYKYDEVESSTPYDKQEDGN